MWQFYALSALFLDETQRILDKGIIVKEKTIDTFLASFLRNAIYFFIALLVGLTGIIGELDFFIRWPMIVFAVLSIANAIFHTHLLKKIEITGISAINYIIPFLFLLIDLSIFKATVSLEQVLGIGFLIGGGALFVLPKKRSNYTKEVWGIFAFNVLLVATELYTFKYYNALQNLNEISYIVNVWLLVVIGFVLLLLLKGRYRELRTTATKNNFFQKTIVSKGIDVASSVLFYKAIALTNVAQVNAFSLISPLILLILVVIFQKWCKISLDEKLEKKVVQKKMIATVLLLVGAYLVS